MEHAPEQTLLDRRVLGHSRSEKERCDDSVEGARNRNEAGIRLGGIEVDPYRRHETETRTYSGNNRLGPFTATD